MLHKRCCSDTAAMYTCYTEGAAAADDRLGGGIGRPHYLRPSRNHNFHPPPAPAAQQDSGVCYRGNLMITLELNMRHEKGHFQIHLFHPTPDLASLSGRKCQLLGKLPAFELFLFHQNWEQVNLVKMMNLVKLVMYHGDNTLLLTMWRTLYTLNLRIDGFCRLRLRE